MELQKYSFTSSYTKDNHSKYTVSPTFWGFNIKYDAYVKKKIKKKSDYLGSFIWKKFGS